MKKTIITRARVTRWTILWIRISNWIAWHLPRAIAEDCFFRVYHEAYPDHTDWESVRVDDILTHWENVSVDDVLERWWNDYPPPKLIESEDQS